MSIRGRFWVAAAVSALLALGVISTGIRIEIARSAVSMWNEHLQATEGFLSTASGRAAGERARTKKVPQPLASSSKVLGRALVPAPGAE